MVYRVERANKPIHGRKLPYVRTRVVAVAAAMLIALAASPHTPPALRLPDSRHEPTRTRPRNQEVELPVLTLMGIASPSTVM